VLKPDTFQFSTLVLEQRSSVFFCPAFKLLDHFSVLDEHRIDHIILWQIRIKDINKIIIVWSGEDTLRQYKWSYYTIIFYKFGNIPKYKDTYRTNSRKILCLDFWRRFHTRLLCQSDYFWNAIRPFVSHPSRWVIRVTHNNRLRLPCNRQRASSNRGGGNRGIVRSTHFSTLLQLIKSKASRFSTLVLVLNFLTLFSLALGPRTT